MSRPALGVATGVVSSFRSMIRYRSHSRGAPVGAYWGVTTEGAELASAGVVRLQRDRVRRKATALRLGPQLSGDRVILAGAEDAQAEVVATAIEAALEPLELRGHVLG